MSRVFTTPLFAASSLLLLAACDGNARVHIDNDSGGGDLKTLARLECPEREDSLRRVAAAPDGLSCDYTGEGAEVRLQLVALDGRQPNDVLAPFESELRGLMPTRTPAELGALDTTSSTVVGVESNDEKAHVRVPGVEIDAEGDRAQIRIGNSITIDADDTDSAVNISSDDGGKAVTVNADESGAEIRTSNSEDGAGRQTFILSSDASPANGYRLVGLEARGPAAGPMLVATVRSRGENGDEAADAMKDLVRKNVGR